MSGSSAQLIKLFKRLLVANFLLSVSSSASWLYFSIYIYEVSKDILAVAYIWVLSSILWIIVETIWGYLGDITKRRCLLAIIATFFYTSLLFSFFIVREPYLLVILYTTATSFLGGYIVSSNSLGTLLREEKHGEAVGFMSGIYALSSFIGNMIGSFSSVIDPSLKLLYSVVIIIGFLTIPVLFPISKAEKTITFEATPRETIKGGYFKLLKDKRILLVVISTIVFNISTAFAWSYFGVYYVSSLKGSYFLYGLSNSAVSFIAAILSPVLGKFAERGILGLLAVFLYSFIVLYLYNLGIIYIQDPILILFFVSIPFYVGFSIAQYIVISNLTSDENRSRVISIFHTSEFIGSLMGSLALLYLTYQLHALPLRELVVTVILYSIYFSIPALVIILALIYFLAATKKK
ncbi:MAG: MFS transporter [Candidatus Odinarchaeota archaeon]|nr:MFS transporter [Candidatus Odinarchaeota archaeon]